MLIKDVQTFFESQVFFLLGNWGSERQALRVTRPSP